MRNTFTIAAGLLLWSGPLGRAQQYVISTVAGSPSDPCAASGIIDYNFCSGDGGPAAGAHLNYATGVALDAQGNLYIADQRNNRVRKVSANGVIATVAGSGIPGVYVDPDSGDGGPATSAQLNNPSDVAVDSRGNLYISSTRVRKVAPSGVITTVAGTGGSGLSLDGGLAATAQLSPNGIAVDAAGNLYIADQANHRIRKVFPNGIITTVAGTGIGGYSGDGGQATGAKLSSPSSVAVDAAGNLYIADLYNNRVRRVWSNGIITTAAGTGAWGYSGDGGPATSAQLRSPNGMTVDPAGNLFIADQGNKRVRMVTPAGIITTVAGSGTAGYSGDGGPATSAALSNPWRVAADAKGNIYIADLGAVRLLQPVRSSSPVFLSAVANAASNLTGPVAPGEVVAIYGLGLGPPVAAPTLNPAALTAAQQSPTAVFFGGVTAPIIYASAAQVVATVPYGVTGPTAEVVVQYQGQISAPLTAPVAALSPALFTSDSSGHGQAEALNEDGSINGAGHPAAAGSTVVLFATGEGQTSPPGVDGRIASSAPPQPILPVTVTIGGQPAPVLYAGGAPGAVAGVMQIKARVPSGVQAGNAPVVVQVGSASSPAGVTIAAAAGAPAAAARQYLISTVAGNGSAGYSGDSGPALMAPLDYPLGVALDGAGNLFLADYRNSRVRKVSPGGVIFTVAGNGVQGYSGDGGPAGSAQLSAPAGVAVDAAGNLYIADSGNSRIRKLSPDGIITTVAGNGLYGYSGDGGPAAGAQLSYAGAVALDAAGNLFIADYDNHRVRKVSPDGIITTVAGNGTAGFSGNGGPATSAQLNYPNGVAVDAGGNLYIVDSFNSSIRRVSSGGVITTVTGAALLDLINPVNLSTGVAVDSAGNLYLAESHSHRIRQVSPGGIITTIAGTGSAGYSGDGGAAVNAEMNFPAGIAADTSGNLYVSDAANNVIRLLRPAASVSTPSISAVASAASNVTGAVAPGEIVTVYGSGIGPAKPAPFQPNSARAVDKQLAYTSVLFNGVPAPILYASATQVAAIVPYAVAGASAQVVAQYQGQTSAPLTVPLATSAPALFTWDSSGKGHAAALNQDESINAPANPAEPGSTILLFATGEGRTSPAGVDGNLASEPLPQPLLPVTVTVGGQPAPVVYAGGAPGEVAGVMQINARIPSGLPSGSTPVVVQVGSVSSQAGVTIAVSGN